MTFQILPLEPDDQSWVKETMIREWGDTLVVVRGDYMYPHTLPGCKAVDAGQVVGLITYRITGISCEIVTLNSFSAGRGIGDALIKAVEVQAGTLGCRSCFLVTTNDNLAALGFYQKRGYLISRIDPKAVERARKVKPSIPLLAKNGIPIRDEITLEKEIR